MVKGSATQWFITLGPAEHLSSTIFGKVAGETIFNVLRLGAVPTDDNDTPEYPVKLVSAEVIHNPFEDIIADNIEKIFRSEDDAGSGNKLSTSGERRKRKAVRNKGLLSFSMFGDDDDDDQLDREVREILGERNATCIHTLQKLIMCENLVQGM